ncbi:WD40 repeat-like protein [Tuber magnatum]|uniref:WD40 repeat-like protein n=1 Tax=Tuber magnatum TaxID=42249 RepID=A0A317T0H2_9PEZI|nr:WD40 repeat-like protein [Tuber magnatum]
MASQGTSATPGAGAHAAGSPQALNQIVIEYLSKKGYAKTEAMLRVESAHTDHEGRPILSNLDDQPGVKYQKAYSHLKNWIENSLDIYKPELRRLLFPVFVHSFLQLVKEGHTKPSQSFFAEHSVEHAAAHADDLMKLKAISLPQHIDDDHLARLYRENKYKVNFSSTTSNLLIHFLEETEDNGGRVILRIINDHIEMKTIIGRPTMFGEEEGILGEDEGIAGHTSGHSESGAILPVIRLGPLPMPADFMADVEDELREEDAAGGDFSVGLLDEFHKNIKREESEDSLMRGHLPLPPYTGVDIEREVRLVKESREKMKLSGAPAPALPSVLMYTFHNTNDGLQCVDFSEDGTIAAGGFAESYVRIFSLNGKPLVSIIPTENFPVAPKTRRLIGHSGPIYGVSISPDKKYILSCSEDKSVRLWSLDTYTALVSYKGHDSPVWDVRFGPYGHYFATASHDHTARLWSCDHIYPLRIFAGHLDDVDTVIFHPNSAYVFTGSTDKTIRMWDVQTGNSVRLFTGHTGPIMALTISPDGKWLASTGIDSTIMLWDIANGKRLKIMRGHGKTSIYSLTFSMEGTILLSGGADNTVRCWDVAYGTGAPTAEAPEGASATAAAGGGGMLPSGDGTTKTNERMLDSRPDHLQAFYTKRSPVYRVQFTHKNLCLAASANMPNAP